MSPETGRKRNEADATGLWITAAGLATGPFVALGLARFAYGLLLPDMRSALSWSFTQAGAMNTANAIGYLAGAILAASVAKRIGLRRSFITSVLLTAVWLLGCALFTSFLMLALFRLLAGATGAVTFISGATLVSRLAHTRPPGQAVALLSVYFAGGGLGVAVTGALVPGLISVTGTGGWRWGWVALGTLGLAALIATIPAAQRTPEAGFDPSARSAAWRVRPITLTMIGYSLFGAGYIGYVTFIIAFIKSEGAGSLLVTMFWVVLGLASVSASFMWGGVLGRLRGARGLGLSIGVTAAGALAPLLSSSNVAMFVSALVFGGSFLIVPAAATNFARRGYEPNQWTSVVAVLTVAFATGQCIGPVLSGVLSDGPSGVRAGLISSVVILAVGALLSFVQPISKAEKPAEVLAGDPTEAHSADR